MKPWEYKHTAEQTEALMPLPNAKVQRRINPIRRHNHSHFICLFFVLTVLQPLPVFKMSLSIQGMCQPRKMGTVGAEPFSAKLRYTGAEDPKHPNLIKVTVTMPHIDGT